MSTAREEILGRIRTALTGTPQAEDPERAYRQRGTLARPGLADLLAQRIAEYQATVHRVDGTAIAPAVETICRNHKVRRLGIPPSLPAAWRPHTVEIVEDTGLGPRELDRLDGVLTGCTVAIAETGTLVLAAGGRDGRRALTLVPDLHLCIVDETQIVELVPEALQHLQGPAPVTLISGPSATSDIELTRVEGVHGPRTLEVLLVR